MSLLFYTAALLLPFIVWAGLRYPHSIVFKWLPIHQYWHSTEVTIQPYQSPYTLKQHAVLWLTSSMIAFIMTWFMLVFSWIGIFSENLSWQKSDIIIELIRNHIELSFLTFLILLFGRFHEIPPTFAFKRILLVKSNKQQAKEQLSYFYLKTMGLTLLFNWGLMHLYYLIMGNFIFLDGGKHFIIWNWIST